MLDGDNTPPKKTGQNEIVTSLRVNPELWKLARIEAIKQGITLGEFVDKSLTYLEDCNRIGGKIVGNWNFKRKMKDVSPDKLILAGIYAPEGRIKELESCVKVLFNRINNSVDYKYSNQTKDMSSERCIVAQATY